MTAEKHETAHDLAEEALEAMEEGSEEEAKALLDEAKKMDPSAVDALTEEIEQEQEEAQHYVDDHKEEVKGAAEA